MKKVVFISAMLTSVISTLVTIVYNTNIPNAFGAVIVYPFVYALLFLFVWPFVLEKRNAYRITASVFLVLQWLRAVVLPALGAVSGYFSINSVNIDEASARTASWLFLYELVVTFLMVYMLLRYSKPLQPLQETVSYTLKGNTGIYVLFILVALVLFLAQDEQIYTFFALDLSTEGRVSYQDSSVDTEIKSVIDYGLSFAVILLVFYFYKKYTNTKDTRYFYGAMAVSLVRVCLISATSEGRLAVLYPICTVLILLITLFPTHRPLIVRSIALVGAAVLGLMTVYKVFQGYAYDSYSDAIRGAAIGLDAGRTSLQLDVYFFGVRNIARNIYVAKQLNVNFGTFVIDFFRNTFGVHYFLKDYSYDTTVALYNLYIYSGESASGHLFSSLAYGNMFFTAVLAPFTTVFNIMVVAFIEKCMIRMKNVDSLYILGLVYTRMSYNMFACFPLAWNNASRMLVLGFLIIGGASLIKKEQRCGSALTARL